MKIIASDYDGTLFFDNKVSKKDREAIRRFRAEGNKFGVVTSRDLHASSYIKPTIGTDIDFLICSTGAIITNENGEIISHKKSKATDILSDLISFAINLRLESFTVSCGLIRLHIDIKGKELPDFDTIREFTNATVWFYEEADAKSFFEYFKSKHDTSLSAFISGRCVEIAPKGISKLSAIKEYASLFGEHTIYAVGDTGTDIPMVKELNGFSVENSCAELKAVAKHHVSRVYEMIDEILDNKI